MSLVLLGNSQLRPLNTLQYSKTMFELNTIHYSCCSVNCQLWGRHGLSRLVLTCQNRDSRSRQFQKKGLTSLLDTVVAAYYDHLGTKRNWMIIITGFFHLGQVWATFFSSGPISKRAKFLKNRSWQFKNTIF